METFDYIDALMKQARKGRVIEHTTRVEFKRSEAIDMTLWRAKALSDLHDWVRASKDYDKTIKAWAAVYLRCGTCARGFAKWYENFDPGPEDDLEIWLQKAREIILEKKWL